MLLAQTQRGLSLYQSPTQPLTPLSEVPAKGAWPAQSRPHICLSLTPSAFMP